MHIVEWGVRVGQVSYQEALAAIFIEGWIFIILSLTGVRQGLIRRVLFGNAPVKAQCHAEINMAGLNQHAPNGMVHVKQRGMMTT